LDILRQLAADSDTTSEQLKNVGALDYRSGSVACMFFPGADRRCVTPLLHLLQPHTRPKNTFYPRKPLQLVPTDSSGRPNLQQLCGDENLALLSNSARFANF
jgi:hypothetical protein